VKTIAPNVDCPVSPIRWIGACRLVASRYPTVGLFDRVTSPADLAAIIELEIWTNDRVSAELGVLATIPRDEWVTGEPMASVVMAAFCHPHPDGGRFSDSTRGAWYAARTLDTALAESIYRRTQELVEIGALDTRVEMRLYRADFRATFHDVRATKPSLAPLYHPASYAASQPFARRLLESGSNGVVYRSVRHPGGQCLSCFRPRLVRHVWTAGHFEYRWQGSPTPQVREL